MDMLKITGGTPLYGIVPISGSKNATLPAMCATLLTNEPVTLENVPWLSDTQFMGKILANLGTNCAKDMENADKYTYHTQVITNSVAPYDLVRQMRASYYVLGPLLARNGAATVSMPGGCVIGARPVDMHVDSLKQMGADINIQNGYIVANAEHGLHGAELNFKTPSVGATCNVLMAATLANGQTIINNAAREPEIVDLANMLNSMGAKVSGAGESVVQIEGVKKLTGTTHKIIADRIEAGSYAVAAAITRGKLELKNADAGTLGLPLDILHKSGVDIQSTQNTIVVDARGRELKGQDIITAGYPGFPTDLQAQFMALMTTAKGDSTITENIFENRLMHAPELMRMGAHIDKNTPNSAVVQGVEKLDGCIVTASDLRAGFALVLMGLAAQGDTFVRHLYHLERGYVDLVGKLSNVDAKISRVKEK